MGGNSAVKSRAALGPHPLAQPLKLASVKIALCSLRHSMLTSFRPAQIGILYNSAKDADEVAERLAKKWDAKVKAVSADSHAALDHKADPLISPVPMQRLG